MICKSDCRLCKSKGLDNNHIQFYCPKISNAAEKKKNQLPRRATESTQRSVKSATSGPKKTAGSVVSAITQDDESYAEEDSEVSDYPVYVDTCASDIYTPLVSDLDSDSSHIHPRVTDQLKVEQADGTKLVSSGIGTLAGAPAYVMPDMSDTLLEANENDTVRTVERANQTIDNTITKMLDLPRNTHLSRQHWAMAFTHALKIKNRLPSAALQGQ